MLTILPVKINFSEMLIQTFVEENTFERVACKMSAILLRPEYVEYCAEKPSDQWFRHTEHQPCWKEILVFFIFMSLYCIAVP